MLARIARAFRASELVTKQYAGPTSSTSSPPPTSLTLDPSQYGGIACFERHRAFMKGIWPREWRHNFVNSIELRGQHRLFHTRPPASPIVSSPPDAQIQLPSHITELSAHHLERHRTSWITSQRRQQHRKSRTASYLARRPSSPQFSTRRTRRNTPPMSENK